MSFTFDVDVARTTPAGLPYTEHVHDYVMIANMAEKFYVQHGKIYRNAAEEVAPDAAPGWFWDHYRSITPSTRKLVGLMLPEDRQRDLEDKAALLMEQFDKLPDEVKQRLAAHVAPQAPRMPVEAPKNPAEYDTSSAPLDGLKNDSEAPRPETWTCDDCGQEVEKKQKGVHIARHRRQAKLGRN